MDLPDITEHHLTAFRGTLLDWFEEVRRPLPWRENRDPYRIWISEIMLQQTRVDQAKPYFLRFVERFPDVATLARAPLDDVLLLWEGLGYYSRARHLHQAAQIVIDEHAGYMPDSYDGLRELPGIGPYTAAAITSIAHQKPHGVVDGNVIRVLSRVFTIDFEAKSAAMRKTAQSLADTLIPVERPGDFNEALMELGATVCTPRLPMCVDCPLGEVCAAHAFGREDEFPRSAPKARIPHYQIAVGIIPSNNKILIQQRAIDGMLGGLWEFPGGKCESGELPRETCRREVLEETGLEVDVGPLICSVDHAYSHFRITLHAYECRIVGGALRAEGDQPQVWVHPDELNQFAFPKANRRVLAAIK